MRQLTRTDARALALGAASKDAKRSIEIQDELTREYEFGWVFFYNSVEYVRSGRRDAALFGNAPLIVSREGRVSSAGTSYDVDQYIAAYEAIGADAFEAGGAESFILSKGNGKGGVRE